MIETALVLPLLLLLGIGLAEIGFLVIDYLTTANAVRQGARVGAAAGNDPNADQLILIQVERALCALDQGTVQAVEIFEADANGDPVDPINLLNAYQPGASLDCSGASTSFTCSNTCPWRPEDRSTRIDDLDRLGVRVKFVHEWVTGFWPFPTATLDEQAVMRLEPESGL